MGAGKATQLIWLSFMLSRLAGQDTLTALSQNIPCARLLLNSFNTLKYLGFYLGRSAQHSYQWRSQDFTLRGADFNFFK